MGKPSRIHEMFLGVDRQFNDSVGVSLVGSQPFYGLSALSSRRGNNVTVACVYDVSTYSRHAGQNSAAELVTKQAVPK